MSTYLLTWNPNNWAWDDLDEAIRALKSGDTSPMRWSCGNTRTIPVGAKVFLLRQSVEPKGIVASGWVTRPTYEDPHYDKSRALAGDKANYIEFSPDVLINPDITLPLDPRTFTTPALKTVNWSPLASGISINSEAADELSKRWEDHTGISSHLGEYATELEATEGILRLRVVAHRSRERALRDAKIKASIASTAGGRLRCEVPNCGDCF